MRFRTLFLFDPNEAAGGATPPEPAAPAPAPPPAATNGDGPWAKDLAEFFTDESTRTQVDQFMRERYQPHVTKLEQETAPARSLYNDLIEDPQATLGALVAEIYGEDDTPNEALATRVLELLEQGVEPEAAVAAATETPAQAAPTRDPEVQALLDERRETAQREAYNAALEAKRTEKDHKFTDEEISPYVVAADGDIDQAYETMVSTISAQEEAFRLKYGITEPPPAVEPPAPAALGSSAAPAGGAAPPVQPNYSNMDDALDAFTSELKASRDAPTVVGSA